MELYQITEHVFWTPGDHETDRPNLGILAGERLTCMVDAGNSPAHAREVLHAMTQRNLRHPSFVILTHWHWDHVFGGEYLGATMIAHSETSQIVREMSHLSWRDKPLEQRVEEGTEIEFCRDKMKAELSDKQRSGLKIKVPEISFTGKMSLELGKISCEIIHVGGDHSTDSTIIFTPEEKVVFLGDSLYNAIYESPSYYTIQKLFPLLDQALACKADFYLDGHGDEPMTYSDMAEYSNYLKAIGSSTAENYNQPEKIYAAVCKALGKDVLDEDDMETMEAFIAGMKKK